MNDFSVGIYLLYAEGYVLQFNTFARLLHNKTSSAARTTCRKWETFDTCSSPSRLLPAALRRSVFLWYHRVRMDRRYGPSTFCRWRKTRITHTFDISTCYCLQRVPSFSMLSRSRHLLCFLQYLPWTRKSSARYNGLHAPPRGTLVDANNIVVTE